MRKQDLHPRTADINKKQKNKSRKYRIDALHWLAATFPLAFDNSTHIHPLKLGIMTDILDYAEQAALAGISKSKLREAVVVFTRRLDYLASLKAKEMRVDLLGNPITPVTEEEAESAAAKIKKRVERSLKAPRKNIAEKTDAIKPIVRNTDQQVQAHDQMTSCYIGGSLSLPSPQKPSTVVIKHKTVRQFDPTAVARLKEKLGLSKVNESKKEQID
ncbi:MAG: ProQ/FinO family protein [Legionella sp.]